MLGLYCLIRQLFGFKRTASAVHPPGKVAEVSATSQGVEKPLDRGPIAYQEVQLSEAGAEILRQARETPGAPGRATHPPRRINEK